MAVAAVIKRAMLSAISQPAVTQILASARPDRRLILMLHRMASPDGTRGGHHPERLASALSALRRTRIDILDLDQLITASLPDSAPLKRPAVAITIDDCYPDALEVAAPILRDFDCPATGFIVPNVIEGKDWFWWDQINWLLARAQGSPVQLELRGQLLQLSWTNSATIKSAAHTLIEAIKLVSTSERRTIISQLAERVDTALPASPPAEYRVLNWDELRSAEQGGLLRFGPHTMSHPVLSQCSNEESEWEITTSISRLNEELNNPSRVFCYPVGRHEDFGEREMRTVRAAGSLAAVSAIPERLHRNAAQAPNWRWSVPRFGFDERPGATARSLLL